MNRPWMPLYVTDYLGDTGHLSAMEHGVYLLLIMHYWVNSGLPANDEARLARIARLTPEEWAQVRDSIADLFDEDWRHKRIDEELQKVVSISEKRRKAGQRSAESRSGSSARSRGKTATENGAASAPAHVEQVLTHSHSHSHSHSHTEKEDDVLPWETASGADAAEKPQAPEYAFEEGVIKLTQADLDKWIQAFPHVNVRGELLANSDWIGREASDKGRNWFQIAKGYLGKQERTAAAATEARKIEADALARHKTRPPQSRI